MGLWCRRINSSDRVVIVFSDEEEQSYMTPEISAEKVKSVCKNSPKTKVYTFSTNQFWGWDEIASSCGGDYFPLSNNATQMYGSLMQILSEICNPE